LASIWQAPLVMNHHEQPVRRRTHRYDDTAPIDDLAKRAEPTSNPGGDRRWTATSRRFTRTGHGGERAAGGGGPNPH